MGRRFRRGSKRGYAVRFFTAEELVHTYLEARQEKTVLKLESQIRNSDLVLVDELGYVPFDRMGAERLTGALLDRLTHHVLVIEILSDSYRLNASLKRKKKSG